MTDRPDRLCDWCSLPMPRRRGTPPVMHDECKTLTVNLPRRCKKCRKVKPAHFFSRDASRAEGRFPYCKACQNASVSKFQNEDDELNGYICPVDDAPIRGRKNRRYCSDPCKQKSAALRTKYGLSVADYRRLLEDANDNCPICLQRPTIWQVDHNHSTRRVTGVVCINCNVGLLAYSGHDLERVGRLVAYLQEPSAERLGIEAFAPEAGERPSNLHKVWGRNRYQAKGTIGRNQHSPPNPPGGVA